MRAQLRTYHPIPSLQSGQEHNAKLLQDAPRIKSILKGVQEDRNEPFTWEQLLECRKRGLKPLTSPVSLIFLFGTYCQKVTELHFSSPREFYDLFNRTSISSSSRATAFLWMCWHYLETDGSPEAAAKNPFGKPEVENTVKVPKLVHINQEKEVSENQDPEEELEYGKRMEEERRRNPLNISHLIYLGYLDNEAYLKENYPAEKPVKKARGGVASRKAKTSSMEAHAVRSKGKGHENQNISSAIDDDSMSNPPSFKAGDLNFVLNTPHSPGARSGSPDAQSDVHRTPNAGGSNPSFTPSEPAHNRTSCIYTLKLTLVRTRTKKRKINDSYMFDDYVVEPWEEPDEAGYSEEEARRDLVEREIRRRIKRDFKKRRRQRIRVSALVRGTTWSQLQFANCRMGFYAGKGTKCVAGL
jgi:hypothetical protein